jgi:hypothetical protein
MPAWSRLSSAGASRGRARDLVSDRGSRGRDRRSCPDGVRVLECSSAVSCRDLRRAPRVGGLRSMRLHSAQPSRARAVRERRRHLLGERRERRQRRERGQRGERERLHGRRGRRAVHAVRRLELLRLVRRVHRERRLPEPAELRAELRRRRRVCQRLRGPVARRRRRPRRAHDLPRGQVPRLQRIGNWRSLLSGASELRRGAVVQRIVVH